MRLIVLALLVIVVAAASIGAMVALQYRSAEPGPSQIAARPEPAARQDAVVPAPAAMPPAPLNRALPYEEPMDPAALTPAPREPPFDTPRPGEDVEPPAVSASPPAWQRNAVAVALPPDDRRPKIAVVIDDLGVDRERGARAVALPGPLTMAWLPYAPELPQQTRAAHRAGHELLVHMPMDPRDRTVTDPGPNALLVDLPADELQRRLDWNLARFDGYVGINNHMGSRFTSDPHGLATVMATLKVRGLLFLDSRTSNQSIALAEARNAGVPAVARDVFLDHEKSPESVQRALADLEAVARRHGHAVAIGHPRDVTLDALAAWLPQLERRGFVLVPLSALVRQRYPSG